MVSLELARKLKWLPSLSQLLDEIKGLGWDVERMQVKGGKTSVLLHRTNGEHIDADWSPYFEADTTDDAAALSLLWILEGGKDG